MLKKAIAVVVLTLAAAGTVGGVSYAAGSVSHPARAKHSARVRSPSSSTPCPHTRSGSSSSSTSSTGSL